MGSFVSAESGKNKDANLEFHASEGAEAAKIFQKHKEKISIEQASRMMYDGYPDFNTPLAYIIAKIIHEANRAFCEILGDFSHTEWPNTPKEIQDNVIGGVCLHLANPGITPEESHIYWLESKMREGWVWGKARNQETKENPAIMPWDRLPQFQKDKGVLFKNIVDVFRGK